jgi:hypothetical protein
LEATETPPRKRIKMEKVNYKGRVWTCDAHNEIIEGLLIENSPKIAKMFLDSVHPKKGNECRECARLYSETPPSNR